MAKRKRRTKGGNKPPREPTPTSPSEMMEGAKETLQAIVELRADVTEIINNKERPLAARHADLDQLFTYARDFAVGAIKVQRNLGKHATDAITQANIPAATNFVAALQEVCKIIVVGTLTCATIDRFRRAEPIIKLHRGGA